MQQAVEDLIQIFEVRICDFENYNEDLVVRVKVLTDNLLWLYYEGPTRWATRTSMGFRSLVLYMTRYVTHHQSGVACLATWLLMLKVCKSNFLNNHWSDCEWTFNRRKANLLLYLSLLFLKPTLNIMGEISESADPTRLSRPLDR